MTRSTQRRQALSRELKLQLFEAGMTRLSAPEAHEILLRSIDDNCGIISFHISMPHFLLRFEQMLFDDECVEASATARVVVEHACRLWQTRGHIAGLLLRIRRQVTRAIGEWGRTLPIVQLQEVRLAPVDLTVSVEEPMLQILMNGLGDDLRSTQIELADCSDSILLRLCDELRTQALRAERKAQLVHLKAEGLVDEIALRAAICSRQGAEATLSQVARMGWSRVDTYGSSGDTFETSLRIVDGVTRTRGRPGERGMWDRDRLLLEPPIGSRAAQLIGGRLPPELNIPWIMPDARVTDADKLSGRWVKVGQKLLAFDGAGKILGAI